MNKSSVIPLNSQKTINAWCSYDIANSAYNLSISTVLFPQYYSSVTKTAFNSEIVQFLGMSIKNTVLYEFAIAFAYLVVVFLTPLLSGIADIGGYRKRFMQFFTTIGAMACIGLYWFTGANIGLGITLPAIAVIGFAGSLVYYNSFLPIITTPDRYDKISARGFSFGYAGSMLLLLFSLFQIENFELFGLKDASSAVRISFVEVGIWWLLISQIAFYYLKEYPQKISLKSGILKQGFSEIISVYNKVRKSKNIFRFLLSFFFFSMGVNTVILVAALFGSTELGMEGTKLIVTILIIQVVAIIGATLFGVVSSKFGNKISLVIMIIIWILICFGAYILKREIQFYIMAALVGLVMGGIQSQARSTFSKLIPKGTVDTASYFTFYDSTEKLAIVFGMLSFALMEHYSGSMRNSALVLSVYFIVSLVVMLFTKLEDRKIGR